MAESALNVYFIPFGVFFKKSVERYSKKIVTFDTHDNPQPRLFRAFLVNTLTMNILSMLSATIQKYRKNYLKAVTIIAHYKASPSLSYEEQNALTFLKRHRFLLTNNKMTYLSTFVNRYRRWPLEVSVCEKTGLPYLVHEGKRLFFPKHYTPSLVKSTYRSLLMEQDQASPHRYWNNEVVFKGKTLFDLGSAEGFIALDHIDDLQQVYLFECEPVWMEALEATFEPYAEKVTIVQRYVSDKTDEATKTVRLDDFVKQHNCRVDLVKMDIEGYEEAALEGFCDTLQAQSVELAVCAYHKPEAVTSIVGLLTAAGYTSTLNPRLMCFVYDERPPYFRTGVVNAHKKTTQQV